jgi:hypothetical protein
MNGLCKTIGLVALLFLCFAVRVSAMGGGEKKEPARQTPEAGAGNQELSGATATTDGSDGEASMQNRRVRVSGRVRMVGTGMFPELVITGEEREWFIDKDEQSILTDLQQRIVTVEGAESYADFTFANDMPAVRKYTLKDITLISVQ